MIYLSPLVVFIFFPVISPCFLSLLHVPLPPISSCLLVYCPPLVSFLSFIVSCLTSSPLPIEQSNNSFQQPRCFAWKKRERETCLKKKERRESNAKLKALWKALETAGCPGGNLKILPQETVKEKVWQSVWNMLYIHKGSENSSLIPSQHLCQHVSQCYVLCFLLHGLVLFGPDLQTMSWLWIPHTVFVCCFTLCVISVVEVHETHLNFSLFSFPAYWFPLWVTWSTVQGFRADTSLNYESHSWLIWSLIVRKGLACTCFVCVFLYLFSHVLNYG